MFCILFLRLNNSILNYLVQGRDRFIFVTNPWRVLLRNVLRHNLYPHITGINYSYEFVFKLSPSIDILHLKMSWDWSNPTAKKNYQMLAVFPANHSPSINERGKIHSKIIKGEEKWQWNSLRQGAEFFFISDVQGILPKPKLTQVNSLPPNKFLLFFIEIQEQHTITVTCPGVRSYKVSYSVQRTQPIDIFMHLSIQIISC